MEIELIETLKETDNQIIVFKVAESCNLWRFVLLVFNETGSKSQIPVFSYVFESVDVAAGDFVVIHSESGNYTVGKNKVNTNSHSFYVGEKLFNEPMNSYLVVLIKAGEVQKYLSR